MQLLRGNYKNIAEIQGKIICPEKLLFESLVSKKELMIAFGISGSFISKLMVDEDLPYYKIGRSVRYRVSEISKWLEERRIPQRQFKLNKVERR